MSVMSSRAVTSDVLQAYLGGLAGCCRKVFLCGDSDGVFIVGVTMLSLFPLASCGV
jgi:hypothetical protein